MNFGKVENLDNQYFRPLSKMSIISVELLNMKSLLNGYFENYANKKNQRSLQIKKHIPVLK